MRFQHLLLFLFISMLVPVNVYAQSLEFQLNAEVKEHHRDKIGEDAKIDVKTDKSLTKVILKPHLISVRSGEHEKIYNFEQNTLTFVDHSAQEFTKTSLYASPAFNDSEKRNRQVMIQTIQKAGVGNLGTNRFELEMVFGGDANGAQAQKIEHKQENQTHTFYFEGDKVATAELSKQPIPAELADIYKKYLTYEHRIHPAIIKKLENTNMLFHALSYRNKLDIPFLTESSYVLTSSNVNASETISIPKGYKENYAFDERLDKVIKLSKTAKEKSTDYYASQMNTLWDNGQYIEASLLFHEYSIHHGLKDIEKIKPAVQRVFNQSPPESGVRNLGAAIVNQPKSKEDVQKRIKIIEDAQSKVSSNGYVLNVFLANYYGALGQNKKAIDLILEALEHNPFLAGAYKDLGDKYFRAYEMQNAWASWDQMRRIKPNHQLVSAIQNVEQQVRKRHPDSF